MKDTLVSTAVGETVYLNTGTGRLGQPLLDLDGRVYLQSGHLLYGEPEVYKEAYSLLSKPIELSGDWIASGDITSAYLGEVIEVSGALLGCMRVGGPGYSIVMLVRSNNLGLKWETVSNAYAMSVAKVESLNGYLYCYAPSSDLNFIYVNTHSATGLLLSSRTLPCTANSYCVSGGGSTLVVDRTTIYKSSDGFATHTQLTTPVSFYSGRLHYSTENNMWYGASTSGIYQSADLVTWQQLTSLNMNPIEVHYFKGRVYVRTTTGIKSSSDGSAWTDVLSYTSSGVLGIASDIESMYVLTPSALMKSGDGVAFANYRDINSSRFHKFNDVLVFVGGLAASPFPKLSVTMFVNAIGIPERFIKNNFRAVKYMRIK